MTDTNDNAPYFRQRIYSAQVPENAEPSAVVIKVTAEDRDEDSHLTYSIIDGNVGNAFQVVPDTGVIKVRASLDYETGPRVYAVLPAFTLSSLCIRPYTVTELALTLNMSVSDISSRLF